MDFFNKGLAALILFFVSTSVFSQSQCDGINTPEEVRVYFVNGMNNQLADMHASLAVLQAAVGNLGSNAYRISINQKEKGAKQVFEVIRQRLGAVKPKDFWEWWGDPESENTPSEFQESYASVLHSAASSEYLVYDGNPFGKL